MQDELPIVELVHIPSLLAAKDEAARKAAFKPYLVPGKGQPPPMCVSASFSAQA